MSTDLQYRVRAGHCDWQSSDEEVYEALKRITDPLTETWDRLARAKRIGIKFNQDKPPEWQVRHEGMLQQLVSSKVARAVIRLLRERTDAEIVVTDISFYAMYNGKDPVQSATVLPILEEYGVKYVIGINGPFAMVQTPNGGQMFKQYLLPETSVDVDEFISVAKLKNHAFMGITLCLKNLFGLMPTEPEGHARWYFHHIVRMPYMLADMGRIYNPALNIIDGLIGQAGREWGNGLDEGPVRITNTLIAGDNIIATDACGAYLMGHDPACDWLTPPFHRDRNPLLVASEGGFGTVNLDEIDFQSEVEAPVGEFYCQLTDSVPMNISWRLTTAQQAMYYQEHRQELIDKYAGEYILLQQDEVRYHSESSNLDVSRRVLAGRHKEEAMWLKYVDPDEAEGEHYEVYDDALEKAGAAQAEYGKPEINPDDEDGGLSELDAATSQ